VILALLDASRTLLRVIPTFTRKQALVTVTFPDGSDLQAVSEPWNEPNNLSNTFGHGDRLGRGASLRRYGIVRSGPPGCAAARVGVWRDRSRVTPLAVEIDSSAPSKPNVLKQTGSGTFPWCVKRAVSIADGFVEVKFKPLAGREDQAGGLVWRWKGGPADSCETVEFVSG
jgi:hypothetical protein